MAPFPAEELDVTLVFKNELVAVLVVDEFVTVPTVLPPVLEIT